MGSSKSKPAEISPPSHYILENLDQSTDPIIQQQNTGSNTNAANPHQSKSEALTQQLTESGTINPYIFQEYMSAATMDANSQILRVTANSCMKMCDIYHVERNQKRGTYPNEELNDTQKHCVEKCSQRMIKAFGFITNVYAERFMNPGATVYLGLNEHVADTFRKQTNS